MTRQQWDSADSWRKHGT